LNFCTAVNVNKNILALMLTSVVKLHSEDGGAAESPRSRAASYAATPVVEIWYLGDGNWGQLEIYFLPSRLNALAQRALWRFIQWSVVETPTVQMRGRHSTTELSPVDIRVST